MRLIFNVKAFKAKYLCNNKHIKSATTLQFELKPVTLERKKKYKFYRP